MPLNGDILVFARQHSPRLQYVLEVLLGGVLGTNWQFSSSPDELQQWTGPCIQYGDNIEAKKGLFIPSCGLLSETGIRPIDVSVNQVDGWPVLFMTDQTDADLPFDLFAMTFFLVSRYEEYLPFEADAHGRYAGSCSVACKNGFLHRPIINEWAGRLKALLIAKYPEWVCPDPTFRALFTCDVDLAWAYLQRPWWRILGAFARDALAGNWHIFFERVGVLLKTKPDPFFEAFSKLGAIQQKQLYFFLLGDRSNFDKNIHPDNPVFQKLIKHIAANFETGIHPSYLSHQIGEPQIIKEINRLKAISGTAVLNSRQHFLLLRFPETYRRLIKAGIRHDFSMGYADQIGFRAGIANPFAWYDLLQEQATQLVVHPFQVMDVTLKDYMHLTPEQAIDHCLRMRKIVAETGGEFCLLWHNSSFSALWGWEGWEDVPFIVLGEGKGPPDQ